MGPVRRRPARLPRRLAIHLTRTINGVTVVEFLDYQCPACAAYYGNVTKKLEADYAGKITFVTRNFPLQVHPLAARAAEAAAKQGKYVEMYRQLYDNYQSWALAPDGKQVSADEERAPPSSTPTPPRSA